MEGGYLCQIERDVSPVLPGGKALLMGCMAHVSLLCCHDKGGKLISSGLSRKILWLAVSWEGSLHEARPPHAPFVCLPRSLLHTFSFSARKQGSFIGGSVLATHLCRLLSAV